MKKSSKLNRRRRGWIMLAVIFVLLALSLAVTAFYTQASDHEFLGSSMNAHNIAAARAEQGAQDALWRVRSSTIVVETLNSVNVTCGAPGTDPWTACPNMIGPVTVTGPTTLEVREGGGLLYQYIVYMPADKGSPSNLYTIRSRGFVGRNIDSANLYTSEVEVTVQKGDTSGSLNPRDTYDNVVMN